MTLITRAIQAAALLSAAMFASAQSSSRITTAEIDGHLRFLSSDLLEGRAPATRGGRIAAEYVAAQLRGAGVEPGVTNFQDVPIDVVGADVTTVTASASGKAMSSLRHPDEIVAPAVPTWNRDAEFRRPQRSPQP
jgi:hypothetical protein